IGVATDITEERAAQERAELLAGEMSHRIKNVFTLIQSMFNMAARTADTKEELAEAFTGRLRALVAVNTLTFADPERRVALSDLVDSLLGPLVESGRVRTTLASGFALSGTAAQTVTLAMNELMTNAVKHGALKVPDGHVDLTMSVTDDTFMLRWHEVSPHPVTPPETPGGFGMRVLTGMTKATYDGQPDLDWRPEGLTFTCTWQLEGFGFRAGAGYAAPVAERAVAATIR
ncbi:MAG: sensor histidine kinase, partial [Pseudomonadota bacterium]